MTAGEWVALTIGVAAVIAALAAFAPTQRRRQLIITCVILMIVAFGIGTISTMIKLSGNHAGAIVAPTSTTAISTSPMPPIPSATDSERPSLSTPAPSRPVVRRESGSNPIRLTEGSAVDLDSMSPNWDVRSFSTGDVGLDLAYTRGGGAVVQSDFSVYYYPVSGPPNFAVCEAATARYDSINLNYRGNQTEFCLRTSDRHTAFVKVADTQDPVAFDVIVWE